MGQTAHSINQPSDKTPRRAPYAMNPTEAVLLRSKGKIFGGPTGIGCTIPIQGRGA